MSKPLVEGNARHIAHPETLVTTQWVAEHLNYTAVRIVECDGDDRRYNAGHIPGAAELDWQSELHDPIERDLIDCANFELLMRRKGITNDTTVVLYGDKHNRYAAYALWLLKLYGHEDVRIMDGGRLKWQREGRPWAREAPSIGVATYTAREASLALRAFRDEVFCHMEARRPLVDVRSPPEYRGEVLHIPEYPQQAAQRGGHIPGAWNIPWTTAVNAADGTFKSAPELRDIYLDRYGLTPDREVITYCHIGERSSHTWYVLTYLLGFERAKNYDGSWTEWGNLVAAPIER